MYLKSLELHGFKSFPNRTVLTFERGTTVIVGPNGSGKSNISDAMRWVLGELNSRNIRGAKMEDVIFGGTDQRRPMGYAEVSVTFDNSDKNNRIDSPYDEIKVTRRFYRTSESEYLINGQQCRLRDINEMFMNTGIGREGYSIVGQGRVAELLSRKSEDRRNVFEEAAGIAKFRHKKEDAERRRHDIEANMERILDMYEELEKRIGPLAREAEKARRFLELQEKKKAADVSLWLYDTAKMRADLQKARETLELARHELALVEESLASLNAQDERLFQQMESTRLAAEQLLARITASRESIHGLESELSVLENDIRHKTERAEDARRRIEEINRIAGSLSGEGAVYEDKLKALREELSHILDERVGILADAQKLGQRIQAMEREMELSLAALDKQQNAANDITVKIEVLSRSRTEDGSRGESILAAIAEAEASRERQQGEAELCQRNVTGYTARIKETEAAVNACDLEIARLRKVREEISDECGKLRADKAALEEAANALRRMEEHFEGYGEAVRFVMRAANEGKLQGIHAPVSQLITVNPDHVVAIETSLGANLQHIVVDDEEATKAAIRLLKERHAGRATFYPITTIRPGNEPDEIRATAKYRGYINRADRLVSCDDEYADIIEWLLSRTVIFDNLDNATACAKALKYRVKLVTLDGQVVNAGGSFTGGTAKEGKGSGILSRSNDIDAKLEEAKRIADEILALARKIADIEAEIAAQEKKKKDTIEEKAFLERTAHTQLSLLESAKARLAANIEQIESLRSEYELIVSKGNQAESELKTLTRALEAANRAVAEIRARRSEQDSERNHLAEERAAALDEANALSLREAEIRKDIEMNERLRDGLADRRAQLIEERDSCRATVADADDAISDMNARRAEYRRKAEQTSEELTALTEQRDEAEGSRKAMTARLAEIREQASAQRDRKDVAARAVYTAESRVQSYEERQEKLGASLFEDYGITFDQAVAMDYSPVTAENRHEVVALQTSCREEIRSLGHVNVNAIEDYKADKERYDTMTSQVLDLRESYDKLTEIINGLEEEMRVQFSTAFAAINENFGKVFAELFEGGTAELVLADPGDVLNCGIDIKAAPPGKIIKNLALLSGGEQAFVAIALFFAILKVNPTPFCIFDEIEAALDAVNVFRFGEYIKRMSGETQFILISHRPGTMEIAERLYGVTMQERGVSRVLPMSPDEMEQMKKELQNDGVL